MEEESEEIEVTELDDGEADEAAGGSGRRSWDGHAQPPDMDLPQDDGPADNRPTS